MISIAHGTNFSITRAKSIYMNIPPSFMFMGKGYWGPIPVPIILMVVIYGLSSLVMRSTRIGTYIFATGGNKSATRLSGINVDRIKITMYIISGIFASFGGILLTSRLGSGQPTVGDALLLDVIDRGSTGWHQPFGRQGLPVGDDARLHDYGSTEQRIDLVELSILCAGDCQGRCHLAGCYLYLFQRVAGRAVRPVLDCAGRNSQEGT